MSGAASNGSARFVRSCLMLLIVGLLAYLWTASMALSGEPIEKSFFAVRAVLLQTSFGAVIVVSALACTVLTFAQCWHGLEKAGVMRRCVAWGGLAVFCYARAAIGHAMDLGWFSLAVLVHAVHVLAGSVWAGSVVLCAAMALKWKSW